MRQAIGEEIAVAISGQNLLVERALPAQALADAEFFRQRLHRRRFRAGADMVEAPVKIGRQTRQGLEQDVVALGTARPTLRMVTGSAGSLPSRSGRGVRLWPKRSRSRP